MPHPLLQHTELADLSHQNSYYSIIVTGTFRRPKPSVFACTACAGSLTFTVIGRTSSLPSLFLYRRITFIGVTYMVGSRRDVSFHAKPCKACFVFIFPFKPITLSVFAQLSLELSDISEANFSSQLPSLVSMVKRVLQFLFDHRLLLKVMYLSPSFSYSFSLSPLVFGWSLSLIKSNVSLSLFSYSFFLSHSFWLIIASY